MFRKSPRELSLSLSPVEDFISRIQSDSGDAGRACIDKGSRQPCRVKRKYEKGFVKKSLSIKYILSIDINNFSCILQYIK